MCYLFVNNFNFSIVSNWLQMSKEIKSWTKARHLIWHSNVSLVNLEIPFTGLWAWDTINKVESEKSGTFPEHVAPIFVPSILVGIVTKQIKQFNVMRNDIPFVKKRKKWNVHKRTVFDFDSDENVNERGISKYEFNVKCKIFYINRIFSIVFYSNCQCDN